MPKGAAARLDDGPTSRTFNALELDRLRPAFVFRNRFLKALLPLGRDLGIVQEKARSLGTSMRRRIENPETQQRFASLGLCVSRFFWPQEKAADC